jgi:hypothetical protein
MKNQELYSQQLHLWTKCLLKKIKKHKIIEPAIVDIKTALAARSDKTIKNFSV